jgi:putative NADPH-quinone reductase
MLKAQNLEAYCDFENNIITKHTILQIEQLMFDKYKLDWKSYSIIWCVFTNSQEKSHSLVLDSINAREVSSSPNAGSIVYN